MPLLAVQRQAVLWVRKKVKTTTKLPIRHGATAGGVLGYASGKLAGLVTTEGVTISFKGYGKGVHTVTQKGRRCQFKEGRTLLIVTEKNRIRIQPNSNCD